MQLDELYYRLKNHSFFDMLLVLFSYKEVVFLLYMHLKMCLQVTLSQQELI